MARRPRIIVPGAPHHVTQRGNNRQPVFLTDQDRSRYLQILREHAQRHEVHILGWCLMTNHIHLIAIPTHPASLAHLLREAQSRYSIEWNRRQESVGHVWQNRYYSCPLDNSHLMAALRYVDQNPVRANLTPTAWDWPWSSALAHTTRGAQDQLLYPDWVRWLEQARLGTWDFADWQSALAIVPENNDLAPIRRATKLGEPLGSKSFISKLETSAGRRLQVMPLGRPAKARAASALP